MMADRNLFQCNPEDGDRFCAVAARCMFLDLEESLTFGDFLDMAVPRLAGPAAADASRLLDAFHARESEGSTVVRDGIAIPHVILEEVAHPVMLLVRCRGGIRFPGQASPVFALLMLVEGYEHRYFHLQALAALSRWAHAPDFMRSWLDAPSMEALRNTLLELHRTRCSLNTPAVIAGH